MIIKSELQDNRISPAELKMVSLWNLNMIRRWITWNHLLMRNLSSKYSVGTVKKFNLRIMVKIVDLQMWKLINDDDTFFSKIVHDFVNISFIKMEKKLKQWSSSKKYNIFTSFSHSAKNCKSSKKCGSSRQTTSLT